MTWVLFVIIMSAEGFAVHVDSQHKTMLECFERREFIVSKLGQPIVNYQDVCAVTDRIGKKV